MDLQEKLLQIWNIVFSFVNYHNNRIDLNTPLYFKHHTICYQEMEDSRDKTENVDEHPSPSL